jgi:maltooligosyltrehalose trehalohydrolase
MPDRPAAGLGAVYLGGGRCQFCVWAPNTRTVEVRLLGSPERLIPLEPRDGGYHAGTADKVTPGALYLYRLNGEADRPDPASRSQPQGVHGPSQVLDEGAFRWTDHGWAGLPLPAYVLYELHVGTFTPEGTFDGVIRRLEDLVDLGVTAVELMPVAQFPGERNWGYDGAYPFAVHPAYGGADGLRRLVDACHGRRLAVVLDVVYNHLGPEGNYLGQFGPYFTDRYRTPWGSAVNFDGPGSDEVRRFFIENALHWTGVFHIDALRLDAVHAIMDQSATPFLQELAEAVHAQADRLGRRIYVIAESNLNDPRLVRPPDRGGYGLDAQWSDDFHHAMHVLLTGERTGYYEDFGGIGDLAQAFTEGFVLSGRYSAFRGRRHGAPSADIPCSKFVVSAQTHDQVGNRARGDRLGSLVSFEALKLAAGTLLLSPFIPILFMGEEYADPAPFLYFTSHTDPVLGEAVRRGRRAEFASFAWQGEVPDPQDPATYARSRLNHELRRDGRHRVLLEFYTEMIHLRKTVPALASLSKDTMEVRMWETERLLAVRRWSAGSEAVAVFNFAAEPRQVRAPLSPARWTTRVDSADARWAGPGRTAPPEIDSDGAIALTVAPTACILLTRGPGA